MKNRIRHREPLLFYCQHHLGIGHLMRSLTLAAELNRSYRVVFLSGGKMPKHLAVAGDIRFVDLAPIVLASDKEFVSQDARRSLERAFQLRRMRIMEVFRELQPAVIVTEYFPFGRMQFASELIPLLQAARSVRPKPPIAICTLRDIVDNSRALQPIYDALTSIFCNHLFDAVLFHSDRRFARLEETFDSTVPLKIPVHYTGFVVPNINPERNGRLRNQERTNNRDAEVIVTAGGGRAGAKLLFAAVDAYTRYGLGEQVRMTVSTGPFMPLKERRVLMERAKGVKGLQVKRWIKDLDRKLARARLSVSQCGYNTAVALLQAEVPALLIPYALRKSDTEQMYRARKMEKLGVARIIRMERLSAEVLAREIRLTLGLKPPKTGFDMNGARNALAVIEKIARQRAGNQSKRP